MRISPKQPPISKQIPLQLILLQKKTSHLSFDGKQVVLCTEKLYVLSSSDSLSVETRAASGFCGCWKLEDFVQARDYVGAITLLEVSRRAAPSDQSERNATGNSETQPAPPPLPAQFLRSTERGSGGDTALWLAYCCFHNGDYARARKVMYEGQQCPQFHSGRLSAGV